MSTEANDIVVNFLDYVFDRDNIYKKEKYTGGRTMNGRAFGTEASMRLQYCMGGFFAEGWAGEIKFRIYGNIRDEREAWACHICHLNDVIDEKNLDLAFGGVLQRELHEQLEKVILGGVSCVS